MEEELICNSCAKKWKRQRARGRKPLVCPKCLAATAQQVVSNPQSSDSHDNSFEPSLTKASVFKALFPRPDNYEQLLKSTKNGSVWKCTNCGSILKLNVGITAPPTHRCTPDMVSLKLYERIQ